MKVVAKPIEMIAWFDNEGIVHPIRFKIQSEDQDNKVISVGKVLKTDIEKLAGNKMYVFTCMSNIDGCTRLYEIKYDLDRCKWVLFKI